MIIRDKAQHYIAPAIWEYIEKGDNDEKGGINYLLIEASATAMLKNIVPCWKETADLLPQWACIFEWIMLGKANKINTDYYNNISIRYNTAMEYLKQIADEYCMRMQDVDSSEAIKKLFHIGKSVHHPRVDFL